jgi:hypothetical protein
MAQPSPWDTSGTANSLADAIRRQAAAQAAGAQKAKETKEGISSNPLDQLMQQIQSINVDPTPLDVLMSQASGSAGAQFDPLIAQLKGEIARTRSRGKNNQKEAHAMYNALSSDIAAEMPEITNQMNQASQETEDRYNQTQQQLQDQYNQQAQDQAELFKQLGIQAAAPTVSQQAKDDQAFFQNQNQSDENSALALLSQMKNSDVSYNRQSADNTRLAGNNVAADIGAQLEDYLQGANSKLSGLEAGKQSAISAMLAQLQQQDAERVQTQQNTEYDRLIDMFNLQLKMQELASKNGSNASDSIFKGTNGPAGTANYLGEVYGGDTFSSKAITDVINQVMSSPEAIAGKYQSPDLKDAMGNPLTLNVTPDKLIYMLRAQMTKDGQSVNGPTFDDADVNHAIDALLARLGRLK